MANRVGTEQIQIAKRTNLVDFLKYTYGDGYIIKDGRNNCVASQTYIKIYEKDGVWKYKNWDKGDSGDGITYLRSYCGYSTFQDAVRALSGFYFETLEIEENDGLPFN